MSTYPATTYNELLSNNIPTICFGIEIFGNLKIKQKNILINLWKLKIFHPDYESAVSHINKIWNNIDSWWLSNNVQNIKKKFVDEYAQPPKDILSILKL